MKKIFYLLYLPAVLLLVSCRVPNPNEAFEQIRIGVILPLSGEYAVQGKGALDGMEIAVRECNKKGGIDGRKVQLCIYNSAGKPDKAAEIARDIIMNNNIVGLVGAYSSSEAVEIKLAAEELGVPYVANMATHESLADGAEYTFQSTLNDEIQGAALAYYMAYKRKFVKPAVMLNTDLSAVYPRGIGRKTAQAWADFTGRSPMLLTYSAEQKSFAGQIKKCIEEDVDVIVLPAYYDCALRFIREARKLNYTGSFAGSDSYDTPLFTDTEYDIGDCFYTTPYFAGNKSDVNNAFLKLMKKYYNRAPGCAEAMGYDGIRFLLKAVKTAYSPEEIAINLRSMRSFPGVSGTMEIHPRRKMLLHPVFVMETAGKKNAPVHCWTVDTERLKNYQQHE